MKENLKNHFLISMKGGGEPQNNEVEIQITGYKTDLRSGIIKAMKKNNTLAELIIDASEYYQKNAQNFEYNK